jgi:dihydroorotate dehydrogenase
MPGEWKFCGLTVDSPLGIAAGPLLNGRWILYYASLGFDVLTYKTVRSRARTCYELPNLQPVAGEQLNGSEAAIAASRKMQGTWAVSFGMPSRTPDVWRADVENTRSRLPRGKLPVVSVVGTVQEGWSIEDLARDYAQCARWAVESGADCVEANFSCPNVSTCDGQLYQDVAGARVVAQCVREAIGRVPLVIKIGYIPHREATGALLEAIGGEVSALSMVNTVAREVSLEQVRRFAEVIGQLGLRTQIIGVGGIATAEDVHARLAAGAHAVQLATAAMVDPTVGVRIRQSSALALDSKL